MIKPRDGIEFLVIIGFVWLLEYVFGHQFIAAPLLAWVVVLWSLLKTLYFVFENAQHLIEATSKDIAYHQFLMLMCFNIGQIAFSFALDFYCLYHINPASFEGVQADFTKIEQIFEFFYFSILNFSFFGYGNLMPTTVPSKIVLLLEVVFAFLTVIFILSDFISMKDSLKKREEL